MNASTSDSTRRIGASDPRDPRAGVLLQAFSAEPGVQAQQQGAPTPLARRP
jgi:hypothetical protein